MLKRLFNKKQVPFKFIEPDLDARKIKTKILFVDDNYFPVVDILKKGGWPNVNLVEDIENLDSHIVKESQIIFVDIHGIGKALDFKNEGLGLVSALKRKYPEKRVVVYSAESKGDRFSEDLEAADRRLKKNAEPYRFISLVEQYSEEFFTYERCVTRLQALLKDEFNTVLTEEEVKEKIANLQRDNSFTERDVSKVFNLNNVGSLASIISLLFSGS